MKCRISQAHVRVFRAVKGAVINAAHGHPTWEIDKAMADSIAKRATGTLTAQWPDVLAARDTPSEANDPVLGGHWPPRRGSRRLARGVVLRQGHPPLLRRLHNIIGNWAGTARREENHMKLQVLIEVLREIKKLEG